MMRPVELFLGLWLTGFPLWMGAGTTAYSAMPEGTSDRSAVRDSSSALLDLSDDELFRLVETDVRAIGSLSIGAPGSAILFNSVPLRPDPRWEIPESAESWGTAETIDAISTAVGKVHELYPDSPSLTIGDISDPDGGRLKRHTSHRGGRDVDFGFYYKGGPQPHFVAGTAANMDLPRNWALVRALVTATDVEVILLDTRVQRILYNYALSIGEDKAWLDRVFQFSRGLRTAVVRHVPRHRNHYHVRFYSPVAQELGRRAHPYLVQLKIIEPPVYTVRHVVRPGQTMGHLASRYGVSVRSIQRANGMRSTMLRAGRPVQIPMKTPAPPPAPVVVPLRTLPPGTPATLASVEWPTFAGLYGERVGTMVWNDALVSFAFRRF